MTNPATTPAASPFLNDVRAIGAAEVKTEVRAEQIAAYLVEKGADHTVAGVIPAAIHFLATGCTCAAGRGKTCSCGLRPAVKTGSKGEQAPTNYGRGVDKLSKAVTALLKTDAEPVVALRVTLSGEGGGSAVVPADHELYAALVALITASQAV